MRCSKRKRWGFWLLLLLVVLAWIYQNLSEAQKRFVHNILRQAPYLPARYAV